MRSAFDAVFRSRSATLSAGGLAPLDCVGVRGGVCGAAVDATRPIAVTTIRPTDNQRFMAKSSSSLGYGRVLFGMHQDFVMIYRVVIDTRPLRAEYCDSSQEARRLRRTADRRTHYLRRGP